MSDFDWGMVNGINLGLSFAVFVHVVVHIAWPAIRARWSK